MPRPTLIPGENRILHGGDYNPDQWLAYPEILNEDFRLMPLAGCNTFSIGIFAWVSYEPEEGTVSFDWLNRIMDRMAAQNQRVILATPSGAMPDWMAAKYPEIRRVDRQGLRAPYRDRHNHCWTSPVYRDKVTEMNTRLAERFGKHPALGMWHLSNEYSGECLCPLCRAEWAKWLEAKYGSLEKMNDAWWSHFWSHTYTSFNTVEPADSTVDGMMVDWLRFSNDRLIDFMRHEMAPLRRLTPDVLCTTNFMGTNGHLNYAEIAKHVDLIADDQYPAYSSEITDLASSGNYVAFKDNLYRGFHPDRPWMLMESCPESPQWCSPMRTKDPGLHRLEMLQAIGLGAEGTCYFQWRKGKGGMEKFHGAVVDHVGHENTRAFRGVAELGALYQRMEGVVGSKVLAEVAMIHDWESQWGYELSSGPGNGRKDYLHTAVTLHRGLWERGYGVDVLGQDREWDQYPLVIAPRMWMLKPGTAERIRDYVAQGGTLVMDALGGVCDEYNRVLPGGWPGGGLREVAGIWVEEWDWLDEKTHRTARSVDGNSLGLSGSSEVERWAMIAHLEGAEAVAIFEDGWYRGAPAVSVNAYGKGRCITLLGEPDIAVVRRLMGHLGRELHLHGAVSDLPRGVAAQRRVKEDQTYVFLQNFTKDRQTVGIGGRWRSLVNDIEIEGSHILNPLGSDVLIQLP